MLIWDCNLCGNRKRCSDDEAPPIFCSSCRKDVIRSIEKTSSILEILKQLVKDVEEMKMMINENKEVK